ncbi:20 kDa chaperonin [Durusdinium trenchii]|uniref:Chloroplastic (Chaperonin 10) (Ch-CPN10) (Cpn10) (Protein Cpn21) n=1 Tax=Durusdinium trenchii TaxID=1381693 RepID=A0ABP0PGK7_9DINO
MAAPLRRSRPVSRLLSLLISGFFVTLHPTFTGLRANRQEGRCRLKGLASLKVDGSVEPLGKFLLVKSAKVEEVTKAGLLLPKSEKPKEGEVVATGPGEAHVESGHLVPLSVEVGEKVLYSKYGGSEAIECQGEEHVLVREDDVLLKYQGDEPVLEKISMPRGKVLVKLLPKEEETSFGLLLSEGAKKQTTTAGEVADVRQFVRRGEMVRRQMMSVGAGMILANGEELPAPVQVGDKVRFRYGDEVNLDLGEDQFSVVSLSDCIAKW